MTLREVKRGDPGVSRGIYATVMYVFGLTPRLANLANSRANEVGLQFGKERSPKRVRAAGGAQRKTA